MMDNHILERFCKFKELNTSHKWKYISNCDCICTTCGIKVFIFSDPTNWHQYGSTVYKDVEVPTCSTVQMRKALL